VRRLRSPAEQPRFIAQHEAVTSGITKVCASLLCVVAAVEAGAPAPQLHVPQGFSASLYVRGITGARELRLAADGTLTLRGTARDDRFEIVPPTDDSPATVMRVAAELDDPRATGTATRAVQAPRFVRLRWNAASGELDYTVAPAHAERVPVAPRTLALARKLARQPQADVAIAPDGTLFVADSLAGAVWRVRPTSL